MTDLSSNALEILQARYLRKTEFWETPDELFQRVAKHITTAEQKDPDMWFERFYRIMQHLEFLPNSPTLMNAGLPYGQLSACFVLPIADSLESIFNTLKEAALIHHSGGGTGYNFSKLRPEGDSIASSGGSSAGPVAFMKIYDTATEQVKQAGKRRGANMGILNVDHPDIEMFISAKSDGKTLGNFNISVGITDNFMEAVENDGDWALIHPGTKHVSRTVKAKRLWKSITEQAHQTGDPGLIFLDTINKRNPIPQQGNIQSTNPCGEVPLLPFESCNLGSINLSKMIKKQGDTVRIDWKKLGDTVAIAIRFLDNVISTNEYPLPEIKRTTLDNRKIGLGVMGWAELLIMLNIPYASPKAVALSEKLMQFVQKKSYRASGNMAKEKGPFPSWKTSRHAPNLLLRNATCNSIAPTGSISVIADTSYSIEPLYALAFERTGILGDVTQTEINPVFVDKMKSFGQWGNEIEGEAVAKGSIQHIHTIPEHIRELFRTSHEIPWKYHLLHQRGFQKYTDNAVSKTVNLPESTPIEEVSQIYLTAWEYGLKGITVYRNGSRTNQVLQTCGLDSENEFACA